MLSNLLLVAGVATLSLAFRAFHHPILHKAGLASIFATSFLIGYLPTGNLGVGALCAATWLLLPWFEILTRVRRLRLPAEKDLRHKSPPPEDAFPSLDELTREIEEEGFVHAGDAGWDWEDYRQFFRLFYNAGDRTRATICLVDQEDVSFYYLSISSRGKDGKIWTTWNYPFSYSLKVVPQLALNRVRNDRSFPELCRCHRTFLEKQRVSEADLVGTEPDQLRAEIQRDLQEQISHNLSRGLLKWSGTNHIAYTWRGLLFLWVQFLRDIIRIP